MKSKNIFKKFLAFTILYTILFSNSSISYANNAELINNEEIRNQTQNTKQKEETNKSSSFSALETQDLENNTNPENQADLSAKDALELSAASAVLIDANSGLVLYDKNMNEKMYPASMTKVMTSILLLEYGNPDEKITHSHNAVFNIGQGSSHIGMREGEEITLDQALYAMLLASANEVCMAVAEHISGSVDAFVEKMNEKAKEIGAKNTNFINPHGFHTENHYTTSYDMALILKEALKYEKFVEVIGTETYTIPETNIINEKRVLNNTNKMIKNWSEFYYPNVVGGKTGFTNEAGNTLASYGKSNGVELISVVMKSEGTNVYTDTQKLLEYGFSLYNETEIFNKDNFSSSASVGQTFNEKVIDLGQIEVSAKESISLKLPKTLDISSITQKVNIPEVVEGPVRVGDKVGTIQFMYNNSVIAETDIISNTDVAVIEEAKLVRKEKFSNLVKTTLTVFKYIGLFLIITTIVLIIIAIISRRIRRNRRKRLRFSNYNQGYYYPKNKRRKRR